MAEIEVEESFETTTVRKKTVKRSIKIEEVSKYTHTQTHKHTHTLYEFVIKFVAQSSKVPSIKSRKCALIMHDLFE